MISIYLLVIGAILFILSVIDWKFKAIPSILLTGFLFVMAVANPENIFYGLISFIMAYLLFEAKFFCGVADVKVMASIGFMIGSINWAMLYVCLILFFGLIFKILMKWRTKEEEIAFIPVFLFVYIAMAILGGVA